MTNDEIRNLAEDYLTKRKIPFVGPCEFGEKSGDKQEVIFMNPHTLIPGAVVDPPDIKVWVNTETKEVTYIRQM